MNDIAKLVSPVDAHDFVRGDENAPATVVEYGDYADPHSGQAYFVLKQLQNDGDGSPFRLVFRNFPLTQIRPESLPAALAAEAAGLQSAFWDMHAILFEHQDSVEPEHLIVYAQVLGLDIEQFIIDMTSDAVATSVREDFISGIRSGVNGTPTLYVNGERYDGAHDYDSLKSAIGKAANPNARGTNASEAIARRRASSRL